MKNYLSKIIMMLAIAISFSAVADAQFVIKIRPNAPAYRARPVAPSRGHVWVSGDYVWRDGRYVYKEGYWVAPPRPRAVWVEGRWKHKRGGWYWVPGHWAR